MSFWNQVIELLSQSPGSLIYHIGVLFSVEATLGMAAGYRQRPVLRRVALAAGGMLLGRLLLMVVALLTLQGMVTNPTAFLPPLERVVDAIGVWLMIWALLPMFDRAPQWGNAAAGGGVVLLLVLYFFSATAWRAELVQAVTATYNTGSQAVIWEAIQLALLGAGCIAMVAYRGRDWVLRIGILAVLLIGHVIHFGVVTPAGNVMGWARLGQLIAYPLLAVSTYRLVMSELLDAAPAPSSRPSAELLEQLKGLATVTASFDERLLMEAAVRAVSSVPGAETVALFTLAGTNLAQVELVYAGGRFNAAAQTSISLDRVPVLRRVAANKQAALLQPGGIDEPSRQTLLTHLLPPSRLREQFRSALLVAPITFAHELGGVLTVQVEDGSALETTGCRAHVELLAAQLGSGLAQMQVHRRLQSQLAELEKRQSALAEDHDRQLEAELVKARQVERELLRQLDVARQELAQAERDVRGLDSWIELSEEQRARIELLQRQLDAVTAEWEGKESVPVTQDRLLGGGAKPEQAVVVAQGVRGPLASISGYTDLLLGESVGAIGELQRLFLQRIKASTDRVRSLLDDLMQTASHESDLDSANKQAVQMADVVQLTVGRLADPIREKRITLQIDVAEHLPALELNRDLMEQIMLHLLSNAYQATDLTGEVAVAVRYEANGLQESPESSGKTGYLFVSVRDSGGGVPLRDQPYVFDRHYRAEHPSIDGLGEASIGLPLVRELLQAQGGRIWLESEPEAGSTFSMVLPASVAQRHFP